MRKNHSAEIVVMCPKCGARRIVLGTPGQYGAVKVDGKYIGERTCRSCAAMKKGDQYRLQFDFWDHDPWKSIRCEAVTENQLHDGWA